MILLLSALAQGAEVEVQLTGLQSGRSVALLVQQGDQVEPLACNDAARLPDVRVDGVWTCQSPTLLEGRAHLALLVDGDLLRVGKLDVRDAPPRFVEVRSSKGLAEVLVDGPPPEPSPDARPLGFSTLVLGIFQGHDRNQSPIIGLENPAGAAQMPCRDDGGYPDAQANDGLYGCVGYLPEEVMGADAPPVELPTTLRLMGQPDSTPALAQLDYMSGGGLRFFQVNGANVGQASDAPIPLLFAPVTAVQSDTETSAALGPVGQQSAAMAPTAPTDLPQSPKPYRRVAMWLTVALAGLSGWVLARRPRTLPDSLQRLPSAALGEGAATLGGVPVQVHCEAPEAALTALVPRLCSAHRVALLLPQDTATPSLAGQPSYRLSSPDRLDVEQAMRQLRKTPGASVVLVVLGRHTLLDPGELSADPLRSLREGMSEDIELLVLCDGQASPLDGAERWRLEGERSWTRLQD